MLQCGFTVTTGKQHGKETVQQAGNVAGKRKRQSQTIVFYDGVANGGTMKKSKGV